MIPIPPAAVSSVGCPPTAHLAHLWNPRVSPEATSADASHQPEVRGTLNLDVGMLDERHARAKGSMLPMDRFPRRGESTPTRSLLDLMLSARLHASDAREETTMTTTSLLEAAFAHHVWATIGLIYSCEVLSSQQLQHVVPGTRGPNSIETLAHLVRRRHVGPRHPRGTEPGRCRGSGPRTRSDPVG